MYSGKSEEIILLPWLPKRPKKQNPVPPKKLKQDWVFRLGQKGKTEATHLM